MENRMLEKLKKLIKKQESAQAIGSIAEAETFATKIQELLAKYNLDMADVDMTDDEREDNMTEEYMRSMLPVIGGESALDILHAIAKFNWCHVYSIGGKSHDKMVIIGTKANVEVCKYIYEIVSRVFVDKCKECFKKYVKEEEYLFEDRDKPVGYDTYARVFIKGAAKGLRDKLRAEQEKFVTKNENAFAVMTTNSVMLKEHAKTLGKMQPTRKSNLSNVSGAFYSGKKVGSNVSINKGVTGTTKPVKRNLLK